MPRPIQDIPALFRQAQVAELTPPKKDPAVSEAGDGWTSPKARQHKRAKPNKTELRSDSTAVLQYEAIDINVF